VEKLSVIIITLNEEEFIEGAIETARFADEIIIMDSYITDKTSELIKNKNIIFKQNKFENFTKQLYIASQYATNDMILFIDADERIPIMLREEIQSVLKMEEPKSAYKVLFSHIFMGKRLKHGTNKNNWKLRLFNKKSCWYDETRLVHEKIIVINGEIGKLTHPIIHYTYRSWNHCINKKNHYAELQAQQLFKKGIKPNAFHFIIKPASRFVNQYFLKAGFLDGFPGFAGAFINSYYVMTRYIKLWLLHHSME